MFRLLRWVLSTAMISVHLIGGGITAQATDDGRGSRRQPLAVATYHQYLGADLAPLLTASAETFNATLLGVLAQAAANRFADRSRRQAALIAEAGPELIGLQEVWNYSCQDLPPAAGACADPAIRGAFVDQLALTLTALNERGPRYEVAAFVQNFD